MPKGIEIERPNKPPMTLTQMVLDFTGTLALDGELLDGVKESLLALSRQIDITILTADTFGTAEKSLQGLPVKVRLIKNGKEKADFVRGLNGENVVAIGNGQNDVDMLRQASLGIAVIGPEGCCAGLLAVSDIVVSDIGHAFGLLENPLRIKATLRQ